MDLFSAMIMDADLHADATHNQLLTTSDGAVYIALLLFQNWDWHYHSTGSDGVVPLLNKWRADTRFFVPFHFNASI